MLSTSIMIHFSVSEHNHTFTLHFLSLVELVPVDISVERFTELGAVGSSAQLSGDVVLVSFASNRRSSMLVESMSSLLNTCTTSSLHSCYSIHTQCDLHT